MLRVLRAGRLGDRDRPAVDQCLDAPRARSPRLARATRARPAPASRWYIPAPIPAVITSVTPSSSNIVATAPCPLAAATGFGTIHHASTRGPPGAPPRTPASARSERIARRRGPLPLRMARPRSARSPALTNPVCTEAGVGPSASARGVSSSGRLSIAPGNPWTRAAAHSRLLSHTSTPRQPACHRPPRNPARPASIPPPRAHRQPDRQSRRPSPRRLTHRSAALPRKSASAVSADGNSRCGLLRHPATGIRDRLAGLVGGLRDGAPDLGMRRLVHGRGDLVAHRVELRADLGRVPTVLRVVDGRLGPPTHRVAERVELGYHVAPGVLGARTRVCIGGGCGLLGGIGLPWLGGWVRLLLIGNRWLRSILDRVVALLGHGPSLSLCLKTRTLVRGQRHGWTPRAAASSIAKCIG